MSTPTPQGISALLKRAGFKRSERQIGGFGNGFVAEKIYSLDDHMPVVRVRHRFWSMRATPEQHGAQLAKYAKTITEAGWAVEAGTYELVVTAKAASLLAAKDGDPR